MTTPSGCVSAVLEGCLKQTSRYRAWTFFGCQKKAAEPGLKMSERQKTTKTGVVKCPMTWEYWTSPYSSHKKDHIPNGI